MKKILAIFILIISILLSGCNKNTKITNSNTKFTQVSGNSLSGIGLSGNNLTGDNLTGKEMKEALKLIENLLK